MDSFCNVIHPSPGNQAFSTSFFQGKICEAALYMKIIIIMSREPSGLFAASFLI